MFQNLANLSFKRSKLQALGFYIVFMILGLIFSGVVAGVVVGIASPSADFQEGFNKGGALGPLVATAYNAILIFVVFFSKKLYKNAIAVILTIIGALITYPLGLILGLLFTTILTTFEGQPQSNQDTGETQG